MRAQEAIGRPEAAKSRPASVLRPSSGPVVGAAAAQHPLLALQSSAGNAAVVQLLRKAGRTEELEAERHDVGCHHSQGDRPRVQRSVAVPSGPVAIQRREDNPHANNTVHNGLTTTAHHVVAHSTLKNSLEKLSDRQKLDVLTAAIPTEITKKMLKNLSVAIPEEENTPAYRKSLRQRLASREVPNTETEQGILFGEIRNAFYEWQAGNQFIGPDTSARAEPKDGGNHTDYDGKYFSSLGAKKFDKLTTLGDNLGKPGIENGEIAETLKEMLAITRNEKVAAFDPRKWTEIEDAATVDRLMADTGFDRAHLGKYTFFKLSAADVRAGKHRHLLPAPMGGDYEYFGVRAPGVQTKGKFVYIPYNIDVSPPKKEGKSAGPRQKLAEYCRAHKMPVSTFLPKALFDPHRSPKKK